MKRVGRKPTYQITGPHTFFPSKTQFYEHRICFLKISKFSLCKLLPYIYQILNMKENLFRKIAKSDY